MPGKIIAEEVVKEFPPIGKYRVRLIRHPKKPQDPPLLDVREYITGADFEGFTRRGIRISDPLQMAMLREILTEILKSDA